MSTATFGVRTWLRPVAAALLLTAAALVLRPAGAGDEEPPKAKFSATATKPDAEGRQVVTITMVVDPDWYAYANPVGNDSFESNHTVVKITSKNKLQVEKIDYPAGLEKKDKDIGNYRIYKGKVEMTAVVRRAAGDTEPLDVSVRVNCCNEVSKQCLPPATAKFTVK